MSGAGEGPIIVGVVRSSLGRPFAWTWSGETPSVWSPLVRLRPLQQWEESRLGVVPPDEFI